ncbi:MAG: inositol monophosphatase family protein [Acidobacteriota bacterium]|nr:inositol monophosphatase family protein [Acidobacteriota bacterium]
MAEEIIAVAIEAARRGGEVLERYFGDVTLVAEDKAQNDYVSRADRESEDAVVGAIRSAFPGHTVLGEEGGESVGEASSEYRWIVDPLDGTTNFLRGVPYFCVSIACQRRGETVAGVVLDPIRDDLFVASRGGGASRNGEPIQVREQALKGAFLATGFPFKAHPALETYLAIFRDLFLETRAIRRCGAAALDLAYTARGVYDGFFEFRLQPWDLAAGALLIEEAGGAVSDLDGGDAYVDGGSLLAGTPEVVDGLRSVVARHTSEAHLESLFRT